MTPSLRKFALTTHISFSVGWLGAVAAFLALAITGLTNRDAQMVRAAYAGMELTARFVIVPLAVASLLTGIIQSLATPWGLFRHYWVLVKLLLTSFATVILVAKMPLIGYAARRASEEASSRADLYTVGIQLAIHAAGGMLVLLVITALSVYKPWGLTRYGLRKQRERRERRDEAQGSPQAAGGTGTARLDRNTVRNGLPPRLRIAISACIATFVVVAHISMYLNGHGFHHGH